jgi:hypothetical protein
MSKEILTYKRVLSRITVSQNIQTLYAINKDVRPYVAKVPNILPVFDIFGTELSVLDNFLKKNPKAYETENIVKEDVKRDFTARSIIAKVQYHYDFAQTDGEREDVRRLVYVVEKYKDVDRKEYETETAYLRSMTNELQQMPDLLNRFGLTDLVAKLQRENEDFETLYNTRTQIVHNRQLQGTITKYRMVINKAFDNVCKAITGLLLIPINSEEKAALESIIDIINAQIKQATTVYNRHAGMQTGKKKTGEMPETGETEEET